MMWVCKVCDPSCILETGESKCKPLYCPITKCSEEHAPEWEVEE